MNNTPSEGGAQRADHTTAPRGALTWRSAAERNRGSGPGGEPCTRFAEQPRCLRVAWALDHCSTPRPAICNASNTYLANETGLTRATCRRRSRSSKPTAPSCAASPRRAAAKDGARSTPPPPYWPWGSRPRWTWGVMSTKRTYKIEKNPACRRAIGTTRLAAASGRKRAHRDRAQQMAVRASA